MPIEKYPEGALIVLDDLMFEAANSRQVCELYTKGSHHRRLSVICIMQNLYYGSKENRTISLNTQYLALFKNPRDQQQIMVLGRQMFPHNPKYLVEEYRKATTRPYGYLLVDLTQNAVEGSRLRTELFRKEISKSARWWIADDSNARDMFPYSFIAGNAEGSSVPEHIIENTEQPESLRKKTEGGEDLYSSSDSLLGMPSCDECGLVFDSHHDVQRHVRNWCPEKPPQIKVEREEDVSVNAAFTRFLNDARKGNEKEWEEMVRKYMDDGMDEAEARSKGDDKISAEDKRSFFALYRNFLLNDIQIQQNPVHKEIIQDIRKRIESGEDESEAVESVTSRKRQRFESLFDQASDNEDDDDDDDDESGANEDENSDDNDDFEDE